MTNDEIQNLEVAPRQHQIRTKVCKTCEGNGKLLVNVEDSTFSLEDCLDCDGVGYVDMSRPVPTIDEEEFRGGLNLEAISRHKNPLTCIQFMNLKRNR
jgi:hypothetical protein